MGEAQWDLMFWKESEFGGEARQTERDVKKKKLVFVLSDFERWCLLDSKKYVLVSKDKYFEKVFNTTVNKKKILLINF